MNTAIIAALLLILLGIAYQTGCSRSRSLIPAGEARLHSRPVYHGVLVAIWSLTPALLIVALWALFGDTASRAYVLAQLPPETSSLAPADLDAAMRRIRQIESGFGIIGDAQPWENQAAQALREFRTLTSAAIIAAAAGTGTLALWFARSRISLRLRARKDRKSVV